MAAMVLLILVSNTINAQGTDSRSLMSKQKRLFLDLSIDPMKSSIEYSNTLLTSGIISSGKVTYNGEVGAGYYFTPFTAVKLGLGYSIFSESHAIENYSTSFESTDSENKSFEMRITGTNIIEDQVALLLRLPISLEGRFQVSEKFGIIVSGGMTFYMPLVSTYNSSGTFSYSGYYPAYPVLLEDIPQYGFPADLDVDENNRLELATIIPGFQGSAGISWSFSSNLYLILQMHYCKSLSDIDAYEATDVFHLTSEPGEMKSFMEASDDNGFTGIGIKISMRYYLR